MSERPRVILVHGAVERAAHFDGVVERLAGFDVVAVDRRGHGARWEEGVGSLDDHVEDLLGLLEVRLAPGVGYSIGGLAVIGAALRRPDRLLAMGLYETSLLFADWWTDKARDDMIDEIDGNAAAALARSADRSPEDRASLEVAWGCCRQDVIDGFAAPFDWRALTVPLTIGYGGASESSAVRDARTMAASTEWNRSSWRGPGTGPIAPTPTPSPSSSSDAPGSVDPGRPIRAHPVMWT